MSKEPKSTAGKTKRGLNLQQEAFCKYFTSSDTEVFGNGTQSYLKVYGVEYLAKHNKPMSYQVAMVNASNLLRNPKIIERVNSLLETGGFNPENVDKQHLFLINQHADLKTKMRAIDSFNELKQRVNKKMDLNLTGSISLSQLFNQSKEEKSDTQ